ncbi:MAG: N-acetyltransferase [Anaerovibrio sp.]|uniref:N-acetyltransferase n=1 Tax=Anaerovibrio sp. TaxID=1872532 RepID=UPI0025F7AFA5|nr:N-acetyltransferase [Anaerovibrio sp.]MCR5175781.1 N-acetyltransferase [Anaerovibrio sp.]
MIYRKAKFVDIEAIYKLVNHYAEEGLMLARSRNALYESLRDMIVAVDENAEVIGVGGLHVTWENMGEIRSLAVDTAHSKKGIGREIVRELIAEGKELGINQVFTLTYQDKFFEKCGFRVISKNELPHKIWKECIDCPKFPDCNEIAMLYNE